MSSSYLALNRNSKLPLYLLGSQSIQPSCCKVKACAIMLRYHKIKRGMEAKDARVRWLMLERKVPRYQRPTLREDR